MTKVFNSVHTSLSTYDLRLAMAETSKFSATSLYQFIPEEEKQEQAVSHFEN